MTYQNLGYWIAQANDLSTGVHPPGWTSGQRWSETASEWNGAYNQSQTDLANMTADRNNWQNSSNTWQGRANTAWGVSRTWNSGESWEAAYNRVLPPASAVILSAAANISNPSGTVTAASVTLNRTGFWSVTFRGYGSGGGGEGVCRLTANGGQIDYGTFDSGGSSTMYANVGLYATGTWGSGVVIAVTFASDNNLSGTLYCTFVPNQTYPR